MLKSRMTNEEISEFLTTDKAVKDFILVGKVLILQIPARPLAVFENVETWIEYRKKPWWPTSTHLENWSPNSDKYYCIANFQPNEFGWILALSFARMLNDMKK